jgi:hypothetical protein
MWSIPCLFESSTEEMVQASFMMFQRMALIFNLKINDTKLVCFLTSIAGKYRASNIYHNFQHAFFVIHRVYKLLTSSEIYPLTQKEMLSLLIAAICHDVDHPGTDNDFEIQTYSDLALTYNDMSVLENHHAATCFRTANSEENNIFESLQTTRAEFKKVSCERAGESEASASEEGAEQAQAVPSPPLPQRRTSAEKSARSKRRPCPVTRSRSEEQAQRRVRGASAGRAQSPALARKNSEVSASCAQSPSPVEKNAQAQAVPSPPLPHAAKNERRKECGASAGHVQSSALAKKKSEASAGRAQTPAPAEKNT